MSDRTALYARVSTKGQEPETQLLQLREYARARGWRVVEEFVDLGVSGAKDHRPALNRLMDAARRRRVDRVLVARFDRFGRSTRHLIMALEEFRSLGVEFVSLADSIDTSTPVGRMTFSLIAAIAEFERELIRERVLAGLHRARSQGKKLGRPRRDVDETMVRGLRGQGLSLRAIARQVGIGKDSVASIVGVSVIPPRSASSAPSGS